MSVMQGLAAERRLRLHLMVSISLQSAPAPILQMKKLRTRGEQLQAERGRRLGPERALRALNRDCAGDGGGASAEGGAGG